MQQVEQRGAQRSKQQRVFGRPFPKGTSGNPRGLGPLAAERRKRREWLRRGLAEAMGGIERLSVDQQALLDMVVEQTLLVERSHGSERTRATNVLLRLRRQLGLDARDRDPPESRESLHEYAARVAREKRGGPA